MTNYNNNGHIPTKEFANIPAIVTVSYFNPIEENLASEEQKEKDLAYATYEVEISASEKGYGPCSYSGCPYDTPFWMEIFIEGNSRRWARRPNTGTFLPGNWEWSTFTSNYLVREDLWLSNIDQARRVLPLLSNDDVYTLNLWGQHCAEDSDFCNSAMSVIRKSINHHEEGNEVQVKETISSDISKWSRWGFKAGAAIGASLINPGAAIAIGTTTWGASQVARELCDSDRGKAFWNTIGGMGENAFNSGVSSGIDRLSGDLKEYAGGAFTISKTIKSFVESEAMIMHLSHQARGINYDSDCSICDPYK